MQGLAQADSAAGQRAGRADAVEQERTVPTDLDGFLASVERRALQMAIMATRDRDEALDIVQEAMTRLVARYRRRSPEEWRPLFYRILHNGIMDWHRRGSVRSRYVAALDDEGQEAVLATVPDRSEPGQLRRLQQDQAMAALEDAVAGLPPRQRQALMLRAWEGLSVEETAQAMGCSQGSVKTHYFRAVQQLKELVEDYLE